MTEHEIHVKSYLKRIGLQEELGSDPDPVTLAHLQRRHLQRVPFENLDIHLGRALSLEPPELMKKIVECGRGGFCYELNGLFALLLEALGYAVTRVSCQTFDDEGQAGPAHDHLALLVDSGGRWLVDVGFGEAFTEPLNLNVRDKQWRSGRAYRISESGGRLTYWESMTGADWVPRYTFSPEPYDLAAFEDMCRFHQSSSESPFTRKRLCTRLTTDGRVTLRNDRLIWTSGTERMESPVSGEAEFRALLQQHFGIDLEVPA